VCVFKFSADTELRRQSKKHGARAGQRCKLVCVQIGLKEGIRTKIAQAVEPFPTTPTEMQEH
jgi:hypothetical protein